MPKDQILENQYQAICRIFDCVNRYSNGDRIPINLTGLLRNISWKSHNILIMLKKYIMFSEVTINKFQKKIRHILFIRADNNQRDSFRNFSDEKLITSH
jgi:hypothetical protein